MAFTSEELAVFNELASGLPEGNVEPADDSEHDSGDAASLGFHGDESIEPGGEEADEESPDKKQKSEPTKHSLQKELNALRRAKGKIAERERASEERINQLAEQATKRLAPLQAIADAADSGDWDNLAAAIAKATGLDFNDWNGLNRHVATRFASPDHKELVRLRRITEEREARDRAEREANQKRASEQEADRQRNEYIQSLGPMLQQSKDRIIQRLAADPQFLAAVFQEQQRAWNQHTESTITPQAAAARALNRVRASYDAMRKLFGDQAPIPEYEPPRANNSRNVNTVPGRRATQVSPSQAQATERELIAHFSRQWQRDMEDEGGS